jgi:hypothetical protein
MGIRVNLYIILRNAVVTKFESPPCYLVKTAEEFVGLIWTEMFRLSTKSKPQFYSQQRGYVQIRLRKGLLMLYFSILLHCVDLTAQKPLSQKTCYLLRNCVYIINISATNTSIFIRHYKLVKYRVYET